MPVLDLFNVVPSWAFRFIQQYKSKEELLIANNRLLQVLSEQQKLRSEEEIRTLKLAKEMDFQRERLGRDLHDCFGSQLTHIVSQLDLITSNQRPDQQQLVRLNNFVREVNRTLRETIWVLDQESLTARAFGSRIQGMLLKIWEDLDAPTLSWQFQTISENTLIQPFLALQIIRIVQEGTNNVLKHAAASQVTVNVRVQKSRLLLSIEDNGCGFDADSNWHGYGISNIRKRAEALNGEFQLITSSTGTILMVNVPKS